MKLHWHVKDCLPIYFFADYGGKCTLKVVKLGTHRHRGFIMVWYVIQLFVYEVGGHMTVTQPDGGICVMERRGSEVYDHRQVIAARN